MKTSDHAQCRLDNTRAMIRRQTTPGTLVIALIAIMVFGPKLWDVVRGHPWLETSLLVAELSTGDVIIEDITTTSGLADGVRANVVESEAGEILCAYNHYNTWVGERKRNWKVEAFASCPMPDQPFRVCSRFHVESEHGLRGTFGPFCSAFYHPPQG